MCIRDRFMAVLSVDGATVLHPARAIAPTLSAAMSETVEALSLILI